MTRLIRVAYYWLPPLVWMSLIFYLSSRLKVSVTGKFVFDFIIFKGLHMLEYALLYFLLFRAFYSINNQKITINNKLLMPLLFSTLYAVSDELHQTLVPTREGKIRDVFIDTSGILLMYIYIKTHINFVKKFL